MRYLFSIVIAATLLNGCVAHDYAGMSQGSGLNQNDLVTYCKGIDCSFDKLKDTVQATASDANVLLSINGSETRTIEYTWVNGWDFISVDLFRVETSSGSRINKAEIYIEKEVIAEIEGKYNSHLGKYNDVGNYYEHIEYITGNITFEQAEKIAQAEHKKVTIRFYTRNGYSDKLLPRPHKLINVVKLAKSAV